LLGVAGILALVAGVDLVCGPLLTLVLASPKRARRERWVDLSLVGAIQLIALAYGLWSVFGARPVALVFEVDRLTIVGANQVQLHELPEAPQGLRTLPWAGVQLAAVRQPRSASEQLESIDLSLQGISPAMRPGWWVPYDTARPDAIRINRGQIPLSSCSGRQISLGAKQPWAALPIAIGANALHSARDATVPWPVKTAACPERGRLHPQVGR
jgi:hypothetical protein